MDVSQTGWIDVEELNHSRQGPPEARPEERSRWYCEQLERGEILFFKQPPFELLADDIRFLVSQQISNTSIHKNVSYRPLKDALGGFRGEGADLLRQVMRRYSRQVTQFVGTFLSPYRDRWLMDYASFRPMEEAGRPLPLHKRNDLLHVDAFPSRPTQGGRILRVFTNLHPRQPRVWLRGEAFPQLAERLASDAGLDKFARQGAPVIRKVLKTSLGITAIKRSAYDRFMLRFHDYLKENEQYQQETTKTRLEFPSMSTWLVFTDGVPHAVLSGQYALEQTLIIPPAALVAPEVAPYRVLERLSGKGMVA